MKNYGMKELFSNLEKVPLFMYQLDALLIKHVPKLADHLKVEGVVPAMYASQVHHVQYNSSTIQISNIYFVRLRKPHYFPLSLQLSLSLSLLFSLSHT